MYGIFGSVGSEHSSNRVWSLFPRDLRIGGSNELPPGLDSIFLDELHTDADITGHELGESWVKRFALVLSIKLAHSLLIEFAHL